MTMQMEKKDYFHLGSILIIAAVLLFFNLGKRDYWSDEIFSLPKMRNPQVVLYQSSWDVHPPFFFLVEYYWIELFGKSEFATRALSSLFGFLTIIVTFLLAQKILPAKNLKFFLVALVTSPFFLFYARMNRYYALTGLLCLTTLFFFFTQLKSPKIKYEISFWISSLLLIYEDYIGFILLVSLTIYYFWHHRKNRKKWLRFIIGGVILLIFYLPWISNLIYQAGKGSAPYPEARSVEEVRIMGIILYNITQSLLRITYTIYNFTLGETVYPWNPLILIGMAGAILLFWGSLRRKEGEGNFWIFALILPFSLYILALIFYSKVFSAANFVLLPSKILFLQPLWLLFLFRGKTDFQLWNKTGFVLLITFNLISLVNYHKGSQFLNPKYLVPWRQLANEITANAQKNDIIVTDEETLLFYLRGKPVKGYGLVGAFEYINEQITPFTIYLVLRHRGEESIYQEGCKLKELLAQKYGIPAFRGVMPLKGGEKALWNKISHSDFVYYIEIYSYKVINQIK